MSAVDDIHEQMAWDNIATGLALKIKKAREAERELELKRQKKIYNHPMNRLSRILLRLSEKIERKG